ncbi:hypothetical protein [Burkholderia contaminans]
MINLEQEAISRWEHGMCAPTLYRLQQPVMRWIVR